MIGFHINMTFGHFTENYLRKWLGFLRKSGYDTVLWETEDAVRWDSCPEAAADDAFAKREFKSILDHAETLRLRSIPLLQTFAHCEYVLRHPKYHHLSEHPEFVELYCPTNPATLEFLRGWIIEQLELFGEKTTMFHLGGDEAWALGGEFCDGECSEFTKNHSKSELYVKRLKELAEPLIAKGVKPAIWADMLLKHGEALNLTPRELVLFDWQYEITPEDGRVWKWEDPQGLMEPNDFPDDLKRKYKKHLPDTFYTTKFLRDNGFEVIGCPASSCYGDNVFSPNMDKHLRNTAGWTRQFIDKASDGLLLTSWTGHQFPYEMQLPIITIPGYLLKHPDASLDEFKRDYCEINFGDADSDFFKYAELLSKKSFLTHTSNLGFNSFHRAAPENHIKKLLGKIDVETETRNSRKRLEEYEKALSGFEKMSAMRSSKEFDIWTVQARNLVNRAKVAIAILADERVDDTLLDEMKKLKTATSAIYEGKLKSGRIEEALRLIYDPIIEFAKRE